MHAGLIAWLFLQVRLESEDLRTEQSVCWIADNQTMLEAALGRAEKWQMKGWRTSRGEPIRQRGLWETYLKLSRPFSLITRQIESEENHPLHRSCDRASRWMEQKGDLLLERWGEGPIGRLGRQDPARAWYMIDAREFVVSLREGKDLENAVAKIKSRAFNEML